MAKIPESVANIGFNLQLDQALGSPILGKSGRTYSLADHPTILLQVRTDQISCFDIVLPVLVPDKGAILTGMSVFWLSQSPLRNYKHHLVAFGSDIDQYLPQALRGDPELQKRGLVVSKLEMLDIECVARGYLTGSGWKDYQEKNRVVCGHQLPYGLWDGAKLPEPIFTPATKAKTGHDQNISAAWVRENRGEGWERKTLEMYKLASKFAISRGIIIADTKLEFGIDSSVGDEVFTPDSSRFWSYDEWLEAQKHKKPPKSYDKQYVRDYLLTLVTPFGCKFSELDPENAEHLAWVHGQIGLPDKVVAETRSRYLEIFQRLVGKTLEDFQRQDIGIAA